MAFIGLKVPVESAKLLSAIDVPGKKTPSDHMHITMLYLGKELEIEAVLLAVQATFAVVASWSPFLLTTRWVSTFPRNPDDGVPIIARIESEDLHELVDTLREAFDQEGVPYNNKYPDYKPHVTLAYDEAPMEDFTLKKPVVWQATGLTLWGGDQGEDVISVNFPFDPPVTSRNKDASTHRAEQLRSYIKAAMCLPTPAGLR